jgi:hypothetical protein
MKKLVRKINFTYLKSVYLSEKSILGRYCFSPNLSKNSVQRQSKTVCVGVGVNRQYDC